MLTLLLQKKSHAACKASDHAICLHRRLQLWLEGDINNLIIEGRTIQHRLKQNSRPMNHEREQQRERTFSNLMMKENVRAALRLPSGEGKGAPLSLDTQLPTDEDQLATTVRNELLKKHPSGQSAHADALLHPIIPPPTHPVVFKCLDGASIRSAALHTNSSAGPSGVNARRWRRLCSSFQTASTDLCNSLALVARRICTSYVDPQGRAPLTASRLIALDKCLGVRPIAVGEAVRRIIGKAILAVIKLDVLEASGTLQLCAGQKAGSEAAIHTMHQMFENVESEAVLLVDASNAFNSLNRKAALYNIHSLCPPLAIPS